MNSELTALYEQDQAERQHPPTPEPGANQQRSDAARRERVGQVLRDEDLLDAHDLFHAAMIFQHGETLDDIWTAHTLASRSADLGHRRARWLAAAALDRWHMYQGKPQPFGTQFVADGARWRLWHVDPGTSDIQRETNDVPCLAEQLATAERMTEEMPPLPPRDVPAWLASGLARWRAEDEA